MAKTHPRRRGRISMPHAAYLVTAITAGRARRFQDFDLACVAARAMAATLAQSDARLLAWVLMPDHIHLLLQLGSARTWRVIQRHGTSVGRAFRPDRSSEIDWEMVAAEAAPHGSQNAEAGCA
jgi:REP element-mobilizing transposase RayT